MEIVLISSALVLQERKQNLRRKFRRVKLFRKEGGKEKEDEAAKKEVKKENSEREGGEKEWVEKERARGGEREGRETG